MRFSATGGNTLVVGAIGDLPGLVERTGSDFVYLALPRSE